MSMSRRGENIYKRKDGRWEGRFNKGRVDGITKYKYVYGKTYKEVREKLAILKENADAIRAETQICAEKVSRKQDVLKELKTAAGQKKFSTRETETPRSDILRLETVAGQEKFSTRKTEMPRSDILLLKTVAGQKKVSTRETKTPRSDILLLETVAGQEKFSTIANEWFASKRAQWKPSSVVKYRNILDSYLLLEYENRSVSEITKDEIIAYSNHLLTQGGVKAVGLSPKTVTNILSVLKNILLYAEQMKGCVIPNFHGISIKQAQKPMRILSYAEQQKLSEYLYKNLNSCNLGVLICLYTGLRIGEICALKWEDISLEEQCLSVHRTMQRLQTQTDEEVKTRIVISEPKSDCSIRTIPIPDEIFTLLKKHKKADSTFVLTGKKYHFIEPRGMQYRFHTMMKHCGIENAHFHALRHTFATRCVEVGFDTKSLSEILGHASVNITLNRYVHPSMELKQKNMNMLSKRFTVS